MDDDNDDTNAKSTHFNLPDLSEKDPQYEIQTMMRKQWSSFLSKAENYYATRPNSLLAVYKGGFCDNKKAEDFYYEYCCN